MSDTNTTDQPARKTPSQTTPPWTPEQVEALNGFQAAGRFHPFTCAIRGDGKHPLQGGDLGLLVATTDGWVCVSCDYTQAWAHEFMLSPEARAPFGWPATSGGSERSVSQCQCDRCVLVDDANGGSAGASDD